MFDITKIQFKNALIRMVGTGEQSKNMLQRRNCKKSATSVEISELVTNKVFLFI